MKKQHEDPKDFPGEQVRSAIQLGMKHGEAEKGFKVEKDCNSKMRKTIYAITSIAAAFIILVGSSQYSPALASSLAKLPIIGSVFGDSDLIGLQQAQDKGLTSQIGETQTINGISVTLDEILYDQNNITVGFQIESDKELHDDFYFDSGMDFTINGNIPSGSPGSYGEDIESPTYRTAMEQISVTEEMPSEFDLGILLQGNNGEKFYFSAPIKQVDDIKKIPVNYTKIVDGIELSITAFSYGTSGTNVSFESTEDAALTDAGLNRADYIEFKMVDQNGNEIESHSGGVQGKRVKDKMIYTSNKQFDPIDSDVTELTITPYLALPTDGGGVEVDEDGNERELEFRGHELEDVAFESFKVEIP